MATEYHREFANAGRPIGSEEGHRFVVSRRSDGSIEMRWPGPGEPAASDLAAALHTLLAVAEERDKWEDGYRRLQAACTSQGADHAKLTKERDKLQERLAGLDVRT